MAKRTAAQNWLEGKQRKLYEEPHMSGLFGIEREELDPSIREAAFEEYLKRSSLSPAEEAEVRAAWKKRVEENDNLELPTELENRPRYIQMMRLSRQIEEAATKCGYSIPVHLQFGTLPTGKVNAQAIPFPKSGEYLVLFDSGVFVFTLLLSKVFAMAMPPEGARDERFLYSMSMTEEDWQRVLTENPQIVHRFQEIIFAYLFMGTPYAAEQYFAEGPYVTLAGWLIEPTTLFLMGHEYGHVIRGHLSTEQDPAIAAQSEYANVVKVHGTSEEKARLIVHNLQEEFEADVRGLELMRCATAKQGYSLALSYWGAEFFLLCVQIVENSIAVMLTGQESDLTQVSDTHPPALIRRANLRKVLQNTCTDEETQAPIQMVQHLERIEAALWAQTKPVLQQKRAAGETLHPAWTQQFGNSAM